MLIERASNSQMMRHYSNILSRNPLKRFDEVFKAMDMFDRPFAFNLGRHFRETPVVDMKENENSYLIEAELPGYKKDDIKISVNEDNILEIQSEKKETSVEKDHANDFEWIVKERMQENFIRSFRFPHQVQAEKIDAVFKDGILTLNIPKTEKSKKNIFKIDVKE